MRNTPIYVLLAIFAASFFFMFTMVPPAVGNDILDGFAISAAMIGAYRFAPYGLQSIVARRPTGPQFLVASAFLLCVAICCIRALRILGVELGIIGSAIINYVFGGITVLMVFGILLLVVAPALTRGKLKLDRYVAFGLFVCLSVVTSVVIYLVRTM